MVSILLCATRSDAYLIEFFLFVWIPHISPLSGLPYYLNWSVILSSHSNKHSLSLVSVFGFIRARRYNHSRPQSLIIKGKVVLLLISLQAVVHRHLSSSLSTPSLSAVRSLPWYFMIYVMFTEWSKALLVLITVQSSTECWNYGKNNKQRLSFKLHKCGVGMHMSKITCMLLVCHSAQPGMQLVSKS